MKDIRPEQKKQLEKFDAEDAARGLLYQIQYLKSENDKLKTENDRLRDSIDRFLDVESGYLVQVAELENLLILTKSLVAIPDNYPDCVAALIRERITAWDLTRETCGGLEEWRSKKETEPISRDLELALKQPKRARKPKKRA